jgi:regulator of protease activity HflC (stomatin/prohibitin superfamily)
MAKYPETLDGLPPKPRRRGLWGFVGRHLPGLSVGLMVLLFAITLLYPYVVITVPSGMVGVLWKRFNGYDAYCWCFVGRGTVLDPQSLRDEGLHIIWPWDKLFLYNLRLQSSTQTYNAITKDGVSVNAQINVRFQLLHNYVAVLHKFIGPAYLASVIDPEIGSRARQVISQFTAQEVYTSRETIQERIRNEAQKSLAAHLNSLVQPEAMEQPDPKHYNDFLQNSIQILDTLVLGIVLPPAIVEAINRQTQQFYEIQEFKYRVEREAQESKRKQIEANGIAAFQRTVSQGISESYLRWRGIEATLALAQSSNAKIVIIGSGRDGMPIILGNVDTPARAKPAGENAAPSNNLPATPSPPDGNAAPQTSSIPPYERPVDKALIEAGTAATTAQSSRPPDITPPTTASPAPPSKPSASSSAGSQQQPSSLLDLSQIKTVPWIAEWLRPRRQTDSSASAPRQ